MSAAPRVASSRAELAALLADRRGRPDRVGLVPTMGALHEGHASLMDVARQAVGTGPVVASIFVNPLQFGPQEDLDRYPRTLQADLEVCAATGVDIVFTPTVEEVYPGGEPQVTLDPGPLAEILEGKTRPGHFRGVLVVVAKLFGLVRPEVAVFGQKDYQQLTLIRRMATDLCMDIDVVGAETVREPDGLAMSSRNRYLGAEQRQQAVGLSRALLAARAAAIEGAAAAVAAARAELATWPAVEVDYLAVTDPSLEPLPAEVPAGTEGRVLVAARVGTTRLIDNMSIVLGSPAVGRDTLPGGADRAVSSVEVHP
ncbi:MAG: pantoate--beta-alanine ligase [Nocardioides sp.]|uniref:pantoate--beta-alanine ligase n=1 Tax=Nocardioides sp. TaxID=35761 RepID=UPI0039E7295E